LLEKETIINRVNLEVQFYVISKYQEFGMTKNRRSRINKEGKKEREKDSPLRHTGRRNEGS
jgi:hypothetical protein